jgi:hypothetical protein
MSSAPSGSQNNGGRYQSAAPRPAEAALLERVLRQTLDICGPDEPLDAAEMRALREVAERHRGRPLELEPVAVELVAAAIDGIRPTGKNPAFWRELTAHVARIMLDDPATFARMNSLWIRLGGAAP